MFWQIYRINPNCHFKSCRNHIVAHCNLCAINNVLGCRTLCTNLQRGKSCPWLFPCRSCTQMGFKTHPDYSDPTEIYHENLWLNRGYYTSSVKVISENDTHIQTKRGLWYRSHPDWLIPNPNHSSKPPLRNHVKYDGKKKAAYATIIILKSVRWAMQIIEMSIFNMGRPRGTWL